MARPLKRVLRSAPATRLAAAAIALYIRLVHLTSRFATEGAEAVAPLLREARPFIIAFWHGRLLMMPAGWPAGHRMRVLISQHRDGEMIARAVEPFGIGTVRGSAAKAGRDKGGVAALRLIVQALKQGDYIAVTPDGPRGPRMRASTGIIAAARLAKVPVVPATFAVRRRRVMNSWDRFIVPWPFNRGLYVWGEPMDVSDPAEPIEAAALRLEAAMNALCDAADRRMGQDPIEPAARSEPEAGHA